MNYSRTIKFIFCQLFYKQKRKRNNNERSIFPLESFITELDNKNLEMKDVEVASGLKVRVQVFEFDEINNLWKLRILRLRDTNIGYIVKPDEVKPIELGDDEYLGEDMTLLFDISNNVVMMQCNRFSLGVKNLERFFEKVMESYNIDITIEGISKEKDIYKIKRDYFKSLEIHFANVNNTDVQGGTLKEILNTYKNLDAGGGVILITLGRSRRKSLRKEKVRDLIEEIKNNKDSGVVSGAVLKTCNEIENEVDIINLFDNVYSVLITYSIAERVSLDFAYCVRKMIERYNEEKPGINSLLNIER